MEAHFHMSKLNFNEHIKKNKEEIEEYMKKGKKTKDLNEYKKEYIYLLTYLLWVMGNMSQSIHIAPSRGTIC